MSSVVGNINVPNNSGTISFGNLLFISRISAEKSFHGQGGGNTGNIVNEVSGISNTNTIKLTGQEQPVTGNI